MATLAELNAKVDELQTALDAEQEEIKTAIGTLEATNAELRTQIVDGGTAEERKALSDKIDTVITDLKATVGDTTPTPPVV